MTSPSTFECFGLVIHGLDWTQIKTRLEQAITRNERSWIVTANPEILLEAKRSPAYWQTIRQADLRLVDGIGLQFTGWFFGASPKRLTGVELSGHLLELAQEKKWKVAFVGGQEGSADKAAWEMRKRFPNLRIITEQGGIVQTDGTGDQSMEEALQRLTLEAPDLVLVAFGHPKQENWIVRHIDEFPSVKIAVGVGGTFDLWSEHIKRAPRWMRIIGFEWLWRFIHEPSRWKRMWNAVIVFPIAASLDKLHSSKT